MEEMFKQLDAQMYNRENAFSHVRDYLQSRGPIRAWYKMYRGYNQWQDKHYEEEYLFLTETLLIRVSLWQGGKLNIRSYRLSEISRLWRDYDFDAPGSKKLVLSQVIVNLKRTVLLRKPDAIVFKRPQTSDSGDPEGFERLFSLLD